MLLKSLATTSLALLLIAPLVATAEKPTLVEVVNADPIPVTVSSLPSEERYQRTLTWDAWSPFNNGTSGRSFSGNWDIPDDKILVIEYISARVSVNPGDMAYFDGICQGADVLPAHVLLPLSTVGKYGAYDTMIGGVAAACYAGNSLIIDVRRNSDVPAATTDAVTVSVVGHFVDRPQ